MTDSLGYLELMVIRGHVLGVAVFRGYARLCDLARISRADIYDQRTNPTGTQRDLNSQHAKSAYEYVKTHDLAFWPEVFLCVRDNLAIQYVPLEDDSDIGVLKLDLSIVEAPDHIAISRVDGNHRLHYADGHNPAYPPIQKKVSFCLAHGLTLEQEISLFRDINVNQRRMNTSHLDNIEARLNPEERLKREQPDLYIAKRLGTDLESPLYGRVYEGGKRVGFAVPLRTLKTGIGLIFSRSPKFSTINEIDAKYKLVRSYFQATKLWQPKAWEDPKEYLMLRGAGLWGLCYIGAEVIERSLKTGEVKKEDMVRILRSGREWDWSTKGEFKGFSGQGGAQRISNLVIAEFQDESGISAKELYRRIMAD